MAVDYPERTDSRSTDWFAASILAGLVASIVMALVAMLASALSGDGFWTPMRVIAGLVFGEDLAGEAFALAPVATGALIHVLLSVIFGAIYGFVLGAFTNRLPHAGMVVAGVIYGFALWAFNTFLVAPLLPGGELIEDNLMISMMPSWAWGAAHLLYGIALGQLYAGERGRDTKLMV